MLFGQRVVVGVERIARARPGLEKHNAGPRAAEGLAIKLEGFQDAILKEKVICAVGAIAVSLGTGFQPVRHRSFTGGSV